MVSIVSSYSQDRSDRIPLQNPNSNDSHHAHLRLALGSILSPKRPHSAQSSTSGTASPAPFAHHFGRPSHLPPDHSLYSPPTAALRSQTSSTPDSSSQSSSPHGSPRQQPVSEEHANRIVQQVQSPVSITRDADCSCRPPLAVVYPNGDEHHVEAQIPSSGQRTPSGRFIATLQSKSAWDALIHGSMV